MPWKVAEVGVAVGTIYDKRWCTGDFGRDDGGCGNTSASNSSLNLISARQLPFGLSANLHWREGWCTALCFLRVLSFVA
jgi:hypothetical protein